MSLHFEVERPRLTYIVAVLDRSYVKNLEVVSCVLENDWPNLKHLFVSKGAWVAEGKENSLLLEPLGICVCVAVILVVKLDVLYHFEDLSL